jgi:IS1 family transposase
MPRVAPHHWQVRRGHRAQVGELWSYVGKKAAQRWWWHASEPHPGKRNTQQIDRKRLTLRTRSTRLTRKTICFSRLPQMHDPVRNTRAQ